MSLKGKTLFITGASRGIGLAIALKAARDGANVAVAAFPTTTNQRQSMTRSFPIGPYPLRPDAPPVFLAEIDDVRASPDQRTHVTIRADLNKASIPNCDRLTDRKISIDGDDLAVA